jgi:hypothetical protein
MAASSGLVDVIAPRPPMDAGMNCVGVRVGRKMMARETALRVIAFSTACTVASRVGAR